MLDLTPLVQRLKGSPLENWADDLQQQLDAKMAVGHGDLGRWQAALDALPAMLPSQIDLLNRRDSGLAHALALREAGHIHACAITCQGWMVSACASRFVHSVMSLS